AGAPRANVDAAHVANLAIARVGSTACSRCRRTLTVILMALEESVQGRWSGGSWRPAAAGRGATWMPQHRGVEAGARPHGSAGIPGRRCGQGRATRRQDATTLRRLMAAA
ncbi:MAG: hypothetical protein ACK58T_38420, partial [Phycisphaerae bacterium]